jgi:hypothetical protein
VLIGGLVIICTGTKKIVIRPKGPSLTSLGVVGAVENPEITLLSGSTVLDSNDDWQSHTNVSNLSDSLKPTNDLEAVMSTEIAADAYTVIVKGVGGGTGVGIIEVFEVQ